MRNAKWMTYSFFYEIFFIPVVWEILCCFSSSFVLNLELHWGHKKSFSPVWISSCFRKDGFVRNAFEQNRHFSGCSSRCISICNWKLKAFLNALLLHRLQKKSSLVLMWDLYMWFHSFVEDLKPIIKNWITETMPNFCKLAIPKRYMKKMRGIHKLRWHDMVVGTVRAPL